MAINPGISSKATASAKAAESLALVAGSGAGAAGDETVVAEVAESRSIRGTTFGAPHLGQATVLPDLR
ncbi:MAG TPA: hypothetical protein VF306_19130 [Pirellulales bacterium]